MIGEIFGFDAEHRIGSICRVPCPQCGDYDTEDKQPRMMDENGREVEFIQPLLIVRKATKEEWIAACLRAGTPPDLLAKAYVAPFHYECYTD